MYRHFFKRLLDFVLSLIALICLSPFLLIVTIWLHFANHGAGAFFFQERPGRNAKIFKVIKFKTMTDERDAEGNLLPDEKRLTRIGRFVRSTSIDELPQLINVLKGDMALIGPRPLLPQYLPLYTKEQMRRHDVRPGISGWAQVNGRNHSKLSQKFANDVWYADNCSFSTDVKIIWMTILNVIHRSDVGEGAEDMAKIDDLGMSIRMQKFGSDFPLINEYKRGKSITLIHPDANYYACGRQTFDELIKKYHWKRIWMPSYFCYEIIDHIKKLGIEVVYYVDYPDCDDVKNIAHIDFKEGDVLLRMNYFGMRCFRTNYDIRVDVIEDHSHDLVGDWATKSDADFCIASLRKTLPISEGGILWSPKGRELPESPIDTTENAELATMRYEGMKRKADFLSGESQNRDFRKYLIRTEGMFEDLPISKISDDSLKVINELDVQDWYNRKHCNWNELNCLGCMDVKILQLEENELNPFSFVILFKNKAERDKVRKLLINRQTVFPAILWNIPDCQNIESIEFGNRMLSIHCDGRYDNDLAELKERIITAIKLSRE